MSSSWEEATVWVAKREPLSLCLHVGGACLWSAQKSQLSFSSSEQSENLIDRVENMSKKRNAQHWYQTHKLRSGEKYVETSLEVAEARKRAEIAESNLGLVKMGANNSALSSIRRFLIGRNAKEEQIYQAEIELRAQNAKLAEAVRAARLVGEQAYVADWVSRNPNKAKL